MGAAIVADQHAETFVDAKESTRFLVHIHCFADAMGQAAPVFVQSGGPAIGPTVNSDQRVFHPSLDQQVSLDIGTAFGI